MEGLSRYIIAIGSSTGGTEALSEILPNVRIPTPPIVVVQHMPPVFSKLFATRLDSICDLQVKEAEEGDHLTPSTVYIAKGGMHMKIAREERSPRLYLTLTMEEHINWVRPSADPLFYTVADYFGANALGILLTGMGSDGSRGLLAMRRRGAETVGQDEATSVVYGMPKAAFEIGAVGEQLPLPKIADRINAYAARCAKIKEALIK
ncbi:hypothetical protein TAMA11512_18250 [Selenomonas sp. TAMA-11512]|uniref:CheB methylesterase domain-containing protein n=1 Tax=Selenomonas sp. TAMA-11512 TaxID=3095337 RepID=UPI00308BEF68|nr:hypothetical protein TAMA11512_18250 [Selenomonas sp. TAMA-11512]